MPPNADLKKNLCTQLYLAVPESNSDDSDDSDVDIDIPEHLPLIQVWLDIGPFQVLLAHLPEVYENHFIAELTAWLRGVEMEPVQEPPGVRNEAELARDFYSRGLRFNGNFLTEDEVELAIDDFFSVFNDRLRREDQQPEVLEPDGEQQLPPQGQK